MIVERGNVIHLPAARRDERVLALDRDLLERLRTASLVALFLAIAMPLTGKVLKITRPTASIFFDPNLPLYFSRGVSFGEDR